MVVELFCFIAVVVVLKYFFYDDDVIDVGSSDFNALFTVAERLEKLYDGKAHVGLQIPDQDSGSRQSIDVVLVTRREAMIVCVKNVAGFISVDKDGRWVCTGSHKTERLPNPVAEAKQLVPILESYLEQRGISLPEGYFTIDSDSFPSEVIRYDQWIQLKPESNMLSGWIKGAFHGGKKDVQESISEKLNLVLSTAPMWDRLELKGNKFVLGEFLEFKGDNEDIRALGNIRRSKVSTVTIQKTSMFGVAPSKLQVHYCLRDYRGEGTSASDWTEVTVHSRTEIKIQPKGSTKARKYKLSSVISMSLSA
ncbi:hypothetical protein H5410_017311 [Solanum commersonii]|uniref:NERD domain-containing protein n=1 Tax=Solanum commersonii TaxID=4109 RepID=A0A9J6A055_SOLCO|nr:hypothetical protein H5410_017311 [Solanum commersonii]